MQACKLRMVLPSCKLGRPISIHRHKVDVTEHFVFPSNMPRKTCFIHEKLILFILSKRKDDLIVMQNVRFEFRQNERHYCSL